MRRTSTLVVLMVIVMLGVGRIGFARSSEPTVTVTDVTDAMLFPGGKAWLGADFTRDEAGGDRITEVEPFSPAFNAGLQKGDRVVAMIRVKQQWDGTITVDLTDRPIRLWNFPSYFRPGDYIMIVFWRDDLGHWLKYSRYPHIAISRLGGK